MPDTLATNDFGNNAIAQPKFRLSRLREPFNVKKGGEACEDGRRVVARNLQKYATVRDFVELLGVDSEGVEGIDMPIEAKDQSNHAYASIDFKTKEQAERVIEGQCPHKGEHQERLDVKKLPDFPDNATAHTRIREFFRDFEIASISSRSWQKHKRGITFSRRKMYVHYLVELADPEEN
ncbi:hypothetical protein B0O99DRAFT_63932 [Bisporella sp. PMI_857]|nr:hypothetical protein B0O99DRAFT_63932 [Bisporella sp. PMI_857]